MQFKAVIFDLGETLLNYGAVNINEVLAQGAQLSYRYLQEHLSPAGSLPPFSRYRRHNIFAIKRSFLWSNITRREFDCLALLDGYVSSLGLQLNSPQIEELAGLWYEPLGSCVTLEPDLHRRLSDLQALPLKLALVSNTFIPPAVHDRHLEQLDLLRFFPVRVYSSATIYRKPDPRIFRRALEQLNVRPQDAVMIGDKWRQDIKGALRLGIKAVFKRGPLNRSRKLPSQFPAIDRIAELPDLIRNWR